MDLRKTGASKEIKRKRRLKFGIKQKLLILFLLVAIIPVVGITVYSTLSLTESYTADRLDQLDAIGANKAAAMEAWFDQRKSDAELMSQTPTISEMAEFAGRWGHSQKAYAIEQIEEIMQSMIDIYGTYEELLLLNTSGHTVIQANVAGYPYAHDIGDDQSHKQYFIYCEKNKFNEEYSFLSDIMWDSTHTFVEITTASVVHDEGGKYVGIIVFYIAQQYLYYLMQATEGLGNSGETYLTDFNGYWLTVSKFSWYVDEGLYDDLHDTVMTELLTTDGIVEALSTKSNVRKSSNTDYRGKAVMGSYKYLMINTEERPWVLVVEIDVAEALAVPNNLMIVSIWIAVVIPAVVAIFGYNEAKRFIDPIIRLNSDAIRVTEDVSPDSGNLYED